VPTDVPRICETCGVTFVMKGNQTVARQLVARFCSHACRAEAGRRDVACEHCGKVSRLKAAVAARRRFCDRRCMQQAWGCAYCAVLVSEERRAAGYRHCSERCSLSHDFEQEAQAAGRLTVTGKPEVRHAFCGRCERILTADQFTKDRTSRNGLAHRCKDCYRDKYEAAKDEYRRRRYCYDAAPGGTIIEFTPEQKAARFSMWGGRCWMCGVLDATQDDHVKPISSGGSHCLSNLRPACTTCNARKRGTWPLPVDSLRAKFRHPSPRPGSGAAEVTPRRPRQPWACEHCGKSEMTRACDAARRFCSRECKDASKTRPNITKTCEQCGADFTLPGHTASQQRKFCSKTCARRGRKYPTRPGVKIDPDQTTLF